MSEIVFNSPKSGDSSAADLQSQIENLQTTLASLNQQVISLQEALQERDEEISVLQIKLSQYKETIVADGSDTAAMPEDSKIRNDETLTVIGALINLYKFAFPPGKDSSVPVS